MAWTGLGSFVLNPAYSPEVNGNVIDAVRYNGLTTDIAAGISACLAKNGENTPTANLPMAGFKHTGAGAASASGEYVTWDQWGSIPQNSKSAAYTLIASDQGKHILHPSADTAARVFTIPSNSSVPYPIGTVITIVNQNSAGTLTISINTDTLRLSPDGTTGSRTLAANGIATILKLTATEWIISGSGLS